MSHFMFGEFENEHNILTAIDKNGKMILFAL